MMASKGVLGASLILVALGAAAVATAQPEQPAYLGPAATPDGLKLLPPPPKSGSAADVADKRIFDETRALQGTPRWALATSDVETGPFETYACALGMALSPEMAPRLAQVLDRASTGGLVGAVKAHYGVKRPYLGGDAPICQARTDHLAGNGDYPSGHTAGGWMEAMILAELVPDHATAILARGRAFGESRAVCGAHSASAVQAGFMAGSAVVAALHGSAEFRADMDAARAELDRIRASAPAPPAARCRAEAEALSVAPY